MNQKDRPVIKHKHSSGTWTATKQEGKPGHCFQAQVFCNGKSLAYLNATSDVNEANANAKLIAIAPELLQIAEMYFDSMKNTDAEKSIAFDVTLKTLNKLK